MKRGAQDPKGRPTPKSPSSKKVKRKEREKLANLYRDQKRAARGPTMEQIQRERLGL